MNAEVLSREEAPVSVAKVVVPVILAGGAGSRLWPMSRDDAPKQMLPVVGPGSLLQDTVARALRLLPDATPVVVCGAALRDGVARQVRSMGERGCDLVVEPVARNTAPAIALACLHAMRRHGAHASPIVLVMPADHVIVGDTALARAVDEAVALAGAGYLVTFGVVPTRPETGYGYIRAGARLDAGRARALACFVEKPDLETATGYVRSGDYLWNCGMFAFRADVYLAELQRFEPELHASCVAALRNVQVDESGAVPLCIADAVAFAAARSVSIDVGVMERTARGAVIPLDALWSDIGAWDAVWSVSPADDAGNVVTAGGDVLLQDCERCLVRTSGRLVTAIGLKDVAIVDTGDAVLVTPLDRSQDVRGLTTQLRAAGRREVLESAHVQRPWGSYEVLARGPGHQTKRLVVRPGGILSLQRHRHRAEHWVVVGGSAMVTCDDRRFELAMGESTHIPCNAIHRLENTGAEDLVVLEVQVGAYLGEDDIERLEDRYGRAVNADAEAMTTRE